MIVLYSGRWCGAEIGANAVRSWRRSELLRGRKFAQMQSRRNARETTADSLNTFSHTLKIWSEVLVRSITNVFCAQHRPRLGSHSRTG